MEIPNLPTDNLYKFMALSGLAVFLFVCYFGQKSFFEINNDIDKLKFELLILEVDNQAYSIRSADMTDKKKIIIDYLQEKFPDQTNMIMSKTDSILIFNILFSMSLKNPELLPIYEKFEEYTKEYVAIQFASNRNKVEKQIQYSLLNKKKERLNGSMILYSIIGLCGIIISICGFSKWYYKIQKYQDFELEQISKPRVNMK